ncbi:MAG: AIR synthase family protein [Clostridia bacterium]
MRLGKLDNEQLERLILSKFSHTREEVVLSPRIGVDCTALELGGKLAVLSTDPITSADNNIGRLTVHVCCNDAAAAGAEPVGLLVTLLVPPTSTQEDIGRVADELAEASQLAGIDIIGGHTEVTDSVTRMVTCATVIAKATADRIITSGGMKPGDDIVLTKHAGLEGAAVIAEDFADRLTQIAPLELAEARSFANSLSVVKEGLFAAAHSASAMHDVTEGGVMGALWEMAHASGCGVRVKSANIPVHPATSHICAALGLDPLRLLSSGCMLISCPDGKYLVQELLTIGIAAKLIGVATEDSAVICDEAVVMPPQADELYKLF